MGELGKGGGMVLEKKEVFSLGICVFRCGEMFFYSRIFMRILE